MQTYTLSVAPPRRKPSFLLYACAFCMFLCTSISEEARASAYKSMIETTSTNVGTAPSEAEAVVESHELPEAVITNQSVFGADARLDRRASSTIYIGPKELAKYDYTDVTRLLKGRSGIHMYEETGWGFRPNLSIRGSSPGRSSGINLMEDGILAAPAPYASPAAYYFPSIGRMQGVEILKGSGQILYGPNTVGGSVNFVSTQVPDQLTLGLDLSHGSFNTTNLHVMAGDKIYKHFGYMVEYFRQSSDGYLHLPDGTRSGGMELQDFVGKFLIDYSGQDGGPNLGKLQLKIQLSEQDDKLGYLGISPEDFKRDPYLRYPGGQLGGLKGDHQQYILSYEIQPIKQLKINVDGYWNRFHRDFHRIDRVAVGANGGTTAQSQSIAQVLQPSRIARNATLISILKGTYTGAETDTIEMPHNDRIYLSRGVQVGAQYDMPTLNSTLRVGVRYHADSEDRLENDTYFRARGNDITQFGAQRTGQASDRVVAAEAVSAHAQWQYTLLKKLTFTGGLRYEHVRLTRTDYTEGSNSSRKRESAPSSTINNNTDVLIPGISVAYNPIEQITIFAGVHRGFRPPGPVVGQKSESSINYELGARFHNEVVHFEAIGYFNRYSNMLGTPLVALGGDATSTDLFNQGKADVAGFESELNVRILRNNKYISIPITGSYTFFYGSYINGFRLGGTAAGSGGTVVSAGTLFALLPEHQARLDIELNIIRRLGIGVSGRYQTGVYSVPLTKEEQKTSPDRVNHVPGYFVMDLFAHVQVHKRIKLYTTVQNLLNNPYMAGILPGGARAGMPRFVKVGVNVRL